MPPISRARAKAKLESEAAFLSQNNELAGSSKTKKKPLKGRRDSVDTLYDSEDEEIVRRRKKPKKKKKLEGINSDDADVDALWSEDEEDEPETEEEKEEEEEEPEERTSDENTSSEDDDHYIIQGYDDLRYKMKYYGDIGIEDEIMEMKEPSPKKESHKIVRADQIKAKPKVKNVNDCVACDEGGDDMISCVRCPASFHSTCIDLCMRTKKSPHEQWMCKRCKYEVNVLKKPKRVPKGMPFDEEKRYSTMLDETFVTYDENTSMTEMFNAFEGLANPRGFQVPRDVYDRLIDMPYMEHIPRKLPCTKDTKCYNCGRKPTEFMQSTACDYCPATFHLGCLDVTTTEVLNEFWMCPLHSEIGVDKFILENVGITKRMNHWNDCKTDGQKSENIAETFVDKIQDLDVEPNYGFGRGQYPEIMQWRDVTKRISDVKTSENTEPRNVHNISSYIEKQKRALKSLKSANLPQVKQKAFYHYLNKEAYMKRHGFYPPELENIQKTYTSLEGLQKDARNLQQIDVELVYYPKSKTISFPSEKIANELSGKLKHLVGNAKTTDKKANIIVNEAKNTALEDEVVDIESTPVPSPTPVLAPQADTISRDNVVASSQPFPKKKHMPFTIAALSIADEPMCPSSHPADEPNPLPVTTSKSVLSFSFEPSNLRPPLSRASLFPPAPVQAPVPPPSRLPAPTQLELILQELIRSQGTLPISALVQLLAPRPPPPPPPVPAPSPLFNPSFLAGLRPDQILANLARPPPPPMPPPSTPLSDPNFMLKLLAANPALLNALNPPMRPPVNTKQPINNPLNINASFGSPVIPPSSVLPSLPRPFIRPQQSQFLDQATLLAAMQLNQLRPQNFIPPPNQPPPMAAEMSHLVSNIAASLVKPPATPNFTPPLSVPPISAIRNPFLSTGPLSDPLPGPSRATSTPSSIFNTNFPPTIINNNTSPVKEDYPLKGPDRAPTVPAIASQSYQMASIRDPISISSSAKKPDSTPMGIDDDEIIDVVDISPNEEVLQPRPREDSIHKLVYRTLPPDYITYYSCPDHSQCSPVPHTPVRTYSPAPRQANPTIVECMAVPQLFDGQPCMPIIICDFTRYFIQFYTDGEHVVAVCKKMHSRHQVTLRRSTLRKLEYPPRDQFMSSFSPILNEVAIGVDTNVSKLDNSRNIGNAEMIEKTRLGTSIKKITKPPKKVLAVKNSETVKIVRQTKAVSKKSVKLPPSKDQAKIEVKLIASEPPKKKSKTEEPQSINKSVQEKSKLTRKPPPVVKESTEKLLIKKSKESQPAIIISKGIQETPETTKKVATQKSITEKLEKTESISLLTSLSQEKIQMAKKPASKKVTDFETLKEILPISSKTDDRKKMMEKAALGSKLETEKSSAKKAKKSQKAESRVPELQKTNHHPQEPKTSEALKMAVEKEIVRDTTTLVEKDIIPAVEEKQPAKVAIEEAPLAIPDDYVDMTSAGEISAETEAALLGNDNEVAMEVDAEQVTSSIEIMVTPAEPLPKETVELAGPLDTSPKIQKASENLASLSIKKSLEDELLDSDDEFFDESLPKVSLTVEEERLLLEDDDNIPDLMVEETREVEPLKTLGKNKDVSQPSEETRMAAKEPKAELEAIPTITEPLSIEVEKPTPLKVPARKKLRNRRSEAERLQADFLIPYSTTSSVSATMKQSPSTSTISNIALTPEASFPIDIDKMELPEGADAAGLRTMVEDLYEKTRMVKQRQLRIAPKAQPVTDLSQLKEIEDEDEPTAAEGQEVVIIETPESRRTYRKHQASVRKCYKVMKRIQGKDEDEPASARGRKPRRRRGCITMKKKAGAKKAPPKNTMKEIEEMIAKKQEAAAAKVTDESAPFTEILKREPELPSIPLVTARRGRPSRARTLSTAATDPPTTIRRTRASSQRGPEPAIPAEPPAVTRSSRLRAKSQGVKDADSSQEAMVKAVPSPVLEKTKVSQKEVQKATSLIHVKPTKPKALPTMSEGIPEKVPSPHPDNSFECHSVEEASLLDIEPEPEIAEPFEDEMLFDFLSAPESSKIGVQESVVPAVIHGLEVQPTIKPGPNAFVLVEDLETSQLSKETSLPEMKSEDSLKLEKVPDEAPAVPELSADKITQIEGELLVGPVEAQCPISEPLESPEEIKKEGSTVNKPENETSMFFESEDNDPTIECGKICSPSSETREVDFSKPIILMANISKTPTGNYCIVGKRVKNATMEEADILLKRSRARDPVYRKVLITDMKGRLSDVRLPIGKVVLEQRKKESSKEALTSETEKMEIDKNIESGNAEVETPMTLSKSMEAPVETNAMIELCVETEAVTKRPLEAEVMILGQEESANPEQLASKPENEVTTVEASASLRKSKPKALGEAENQKVVNIRKPHQVVKVFSNACYVQSMSAPDAIKEGRVEANIAKIMKTFTITARTTIEPKGVPKVVPKKLPPKSETQPKAATFSKDATHAVSKKIQKKKSVETRKRKRLEPEVKKKMRRLVALMKKKQKLDDPLKLSKKKRKLADVNNDEPDEKKIKKKRFEDVIDKILKKTKRPKKRKLEEGTQVPTYDAVSDKKKKNQGVVPIRKRSFTPFDRREKMRDKLREALSVIKIRSRKNQMLKKVDRITFDKLQPSTKKMFEYLNRRKRRKLRTFRKLQRRHQEKYREPPPPRVEMPDVDLTKHMKLDCRKIGHYCYLMYQLPTGEYQLVMRLLNIDEVYAYKIDANERLGILNGTADYHVAGEKRPRNYTKIIKNTMDFELLQDQSSKKWKINCGLPGVPESVVKKYVDTTDFGDYVVDYRFEIKEEYMLGSLIVMAPNHSFACLPIYHPITHIGFTDYAHLNLGIIVPYCHYIEDQHCSISLNSSTGEVFMKTFGYTIVDGQLYGSLSPFLDRKRRKCACAKKYSGPVSSGSSKDYIILREGSVISIGCMSFQVAFPPLPEVQRNIPMMSTSIHEEIRELQEPNMNNEPEPFPNELLSADSESSDSDIEELPVQEAFNNEDDPIIVADNIIVT